MVEGTLHLPSIVTDVYKRRRIYNFVPFISVLEIMDITIFLFL
jgi:hypothetical protein